MTGTSTNYDPHALSVCRSMVQREDPDRYLSAQYAPAARRAALLALYAFNAEVAKTRHVVSEPVLGEIRLQWWRDTINAAQTGHRRDHSVADLVAELVLPVTGAEPLLAIIEARLDDLYNEPVKTLDDLSAYARRTSGDVQAIAAQLLDADEQTREAARLVGTAWGLTGLMRSLPHNFARGWSYLPQDLVGPNVTAPAPGPANRLPEACLEAVESICARAGALYIEASALAPNPNRAALASLLLAPMENQYRATLRRAGYDPTIANFEAGALARYLRTAWRAAWGTF